MLCTLWSAWLRGGQRHVCPCSGWSASRHWQWKGITSLSKGPFESLPEAVERTEATSPGGDPPGCAGFGRVLPEKLWRRWGPSLLPFVMSRFSWSANCGWKMQFILESSFYLKAEAAHLGWKVRNLLCSSPLEQYWALPWKASWKGVADYMDVWKVCVVLIPLRQLCL